MKKSPKKLIILGTAATAAAVGFTGCKNYAPTVYGPPEMFTTPASEESSFDPAENIPEDVYGPPEWFGYEEESDSFDPAENAPEVVYGPPEWFEEPEEASGEDMVADEETGTVTPTEETESAAETDADTDADTDTVADETFTAEHNIQPLVYGPPEWFENRVTEQETAVPAEEEQPAEDEQPGVVFHPGINIIEGVYGPPAPSDVSFGTMQESTTADMDPSENIYYPVYGPPGAMGVVSE